MFRTVPLSTIRSFSLYTQQWHLWCRFADSLWTGSGWNAVLSWSCLQAVSKLVWHIPLLCVQWKTPDGGQRNCPKHVEFYSKNKFEILVHLVGFVVRIYHDTRSPERQTGLKLVICTVYRLTIVANKNTTSLHYTVVFMCLQRCFRHFSPVRSSGKSIM